MFKNSHFVLKNWFRALLCKLKRYVFFASNVEFPVGPISHIKRNHDKWLINYENTLVSSFNTWVCFASHFFLLNVAWICQLRTKIIMRVHCRIFFFFSLLGVKVSQRGKRLWGSYLIFHKQWLLFWWIKKKMDNNNND